MARGSRRRRRGEDSEEIPVAEELPARGGRSRAPKGMGFAIKVALAAGLGAGAVAFICVLIVNKAVGVDPSAALDHGGIQAVRMLASIDTGRWEPDFGTNRGIGETVKAEIEAKLAQIENVTDDARDIGPLQTAVDEWLKGNASEGADWRPGFEMYFPKENLEDSAIDAARRQGMKRVQEADQGKLVGVAVTGSAGTYMQFGEIYDGALQYKAGDTEVKAAVGYRIYTHPLANRIGVPDGFAVVVLSTRELGGADPIMMGGAAALGSFLGAFFLALALSLGPVRAMQRLAGEVQNIADGDLGGRVTVRGPAAVVATARAVQRLAALAQEGSYAEPQVLTQQIAVLPVNEIHENLAPTAGVKRPPQLEVESTTKICPDSGNDYHDIFTLSNGKLGVVVADIPTRGIKGAMYMAQIRALLRSEAEKSESPAEVLKGVNRAFAAGLPRGVYVTAMYAVIDPDSGICKLASAQHLPMIFWKLSKKASAQVQTQGIALGHDHGPVFDKTIEEKAVQLDKGDRIVMYTDGALTARSLAGAVYGEERFNYVVKKEAPKNSAAFVNFVANDVDLFHEGAAQMDDFTILTVRRVG